MKSTKGTEYKRRFFFILKIIFFIVIYLIVKLNPSLVKELKIPVYVSDAILFFLSANIVVSLGRILLAQMYLKKNKINKGSVDNFILGINRIADLVNVLIFVAFVLMLLNINPFEFITSLSIVAAAIALLSKDYISNMINGMIIMFSDEISLGDYIQVGNNKGRVQNITLTNIHLNNDDEDLIFIPNNLVMNSDVVNFSKRKVKKISFDFDVKNTGLDIEKIEEYLSKQLNNFEKHIQNDSFNLKIVKINENFSSLKFQFIMNKLNKPVEKEIRKVTLRAVIKYINQ
ncbi:mechanosensitive ion channel family protein [Mangrovivirga cuniculi]|uniref:Mechanosensitive ion channel protein MscS n=1 Tax=Mangrovivirga cuniculi TaxID=2715131 RepID=A0A4D7JM57_9BACT|nr:mechanosensitive ion channel domain-containing protein [Mangrovivirga cuniculi]QCK16671.1 mechanosensitive ion channel protein MscS [Mangrovivirga cuniculi]